jgi:hypothetical protein
MAFYRSTQRLMSWARSVLRQIVSYEDFILWPIIFDIERRYAQRTMFPVQRKTTAAFVLRVNHLFSDTSKRQK